jgi:carboxymethylenebutenolidase
MRNFFVFILLVLGLGLLVYVAYFSSNPQTTTTKATSPSVTNAAALKMEGSEEIEASDIKYYKEITGYYAEPIKDGEYPGVIMIHEWWGLNDNIRTMARRLASFGYKVLAVDLYNGQVATTPDEAMKLVGALNKEEAIANMKNAATYLRNNKATRVGSLGWCFGGGQSLQLSLNDSLDATVIYYGNLVTDKTQLASIQWPVLGIFGDQDQTIPLATVNQFEKSLNDLKVANEIYIYKGVGHAFANPTGDNYAPKETQDAWQKTIAFLEKHLK